MRDAAPNFLEDKLHSEQDQQQLLRFRAHVRVLDPFRCSEFDNTQSDPAKVHQASRLRARVAH
jgi:hypothetical protein